MIRCSMTRLLCVRLGAGPSSATLVNLHIVRRVALSQANIWSRLVLWPLSRDRRHDDRHNQQAPDCGLPAPEGGRRTGASADRIRASSTRSWVASVSEIPRCRSSQVFLFSSWILSMTGKALAVSART
jgi:hypothetical protein